MRGGDLTPAAVFCITLFAACGGEAPGLEVVARPSDLEEMNAPVRRQYQEAFDHLDRLRESGASNARLAPAYGRIGMLFHAYQEWERAAPAYHDAEVLDPQAFRWPYYLGLVEQHRGRLREAAEAIARALAIDPDYFAARVTAAEIRLQRGEVDAADDAFAQLLKLDPALVTAWIGRAKIALGRGAPEEALAYLREALSREPDDSEVLYLVGQAYAAQGRVESARRYLAAVPRRNVMRETLRVRDPLRAEVAGLVSGSRSHSRDGVMAAVGENYRLALVEFEQALAAAPELSTARFGKALVHFQLKEYRECREELDTLLAADPDDVSALELLGNLELAEGHLQEAEHRLRRALELDPLAERSHEQLGEILRRTGRPVEALEHYEAALRTAPAMAEAHFGLCVSLLALDRSAAATRALERSLRALPGSRALQLLEARWLIAPPDSAEGDPEAALASLRRLADSGVEMALAEGVAMARSVFGDFSAAVRWQRAVVAALGDARSEAPWALERLRLYERGVAASSPWAPGERILVVFVEPPEPI
ncbi:MAG: tetratricopeptide repeat protein [Thermoanaerobaculia bacterium]